MLSASVAWNWRAEDLVVPRRRERLVLLRPGVVLELELLGCCVGSVMVTLRVRAEKSVLVGLLLQL